MSLIHDPAVRFIHFRLIDANGDVVSRAGVGPDGERLTTGLTVAYKEAADGSITFAFAKCAGADNFSRKQGAVKAEGRLGSARYKYVVGNKETFERTINLAAKEGNLTRTFRKKKDKPAQECDPTRQLCGCG